MAVIVGAINHDQSIEITQRHVVLGWCKMLSETYRESIAENSQNAR